jgi:hypothetical protein
MEVLTPVIEIATLAMCHPGQDLPFGRAITLELVRDDHPRHVLQAFEQLTKKFLCRCLVPPALHQDVEDMIVLIDRAPEILALPMNHQQHFVQGPCVAWLGASTLQPIRVVLPKLQTPLADGLVRHIDTAFKQQLLHIGIAQGGAIVQPDPMADDLGWKPVIFIGGA